MSDQEEKEKSLVKREEAKTALPPEKSIKLGKTGELDLTGMTEEQIKVLKEEHARGMIGVGQRAAEVVVDTQALDKKLETMATHTSAVAKDGGAVTITSTSDDAIGRTEIMMGTSEAAKKGKFSRSQTGQKDVPIIWIGLGVFVIIIVAIIALMR